MATQVNPLLGATPVTQVLAVPAGARKAAHFNGPVSVGGTNDVKGVALLAYRFDIDKANGNIAGGTTPGSTLHFPAGTILWNLISQVTVAFDGTTPKLNLGTTPGASDIASISIASISAAATTLLSTVLPAAGNVYVSVTGGPFTVGHATLAIVYLGSPALPWS